MLIYLHLKLYKGHKMEEKLHDLSVKVNILESLSRILLDIIRDGENLKSFDTSNLALVVLNKTLELKHELNEFELKF